MKTSYPSCLVIFGVMARLLLLRDRSRSMSLNELYECNLLAWISD
jgi:hypothetical protein